MAVHQPLEDVVSVKIALIEVELLLLLTPEGM